MSRVFITGIGIISSIGNNAEETLASLITSQPGLSRPDNFHTRHRDELVTGEIKITNDLLYDRCGKNAGRRDSRSTFLGMLAAREAMLHAGITDPGHSRTGILSATSVGGMGLAENHFMEFLDPSDPNENIDYITRLDAGDSTERIAEFLGITGYLGTISTACSSSANSIMYAARLIRNGKLDRVIAGGTDSLSRFTVNGFRSLKILDSNPCRPFDATRSGLNLGEGAGYLVLESEASASKKNILCELTGYGNTNDAWHQTASSPEGEGAFAAMQKAFSVCGIQPEQIDYINAHGTGTEINDLSEGLAIQNIFGNRIPDFSSTKSFTGHTLAAAGGIEAVISVMSIQNGIIFPGLNFNTPMPELRISPVSELKTGKNIRHVLSNSFGFGGNTSSLIFSKPV